MTTNRKRMIWLALVLPIAVMSARAEIAGSGPNSGGEGDQHAIGRGVGVRG